MKRRPVLLAILVVLLFLALLALPALLNLDGDNAMQPRAVYADDPTPTPTPTPPSPTGGCQGSGSCGG